MKNMKKILSFAVATAVTLTAGSALAAQGDYYDVDNKIIYTVDSLKEDGNRESLKQAIKDKNKILYEVTEGRIIDRDDTNALIASEAQTGKTSAEIVQALATDESIVSDVDVSSFTEVNAEEVLAVESVSAINVNILTVTGTATNVDAEAGLALHVLPGGEGSEAEEIPFAVELNEDGTFEVSTSELPAGSHAYRFVSGEMSTEYTAFTIDALEAATEAVVKAEGSLLEADLAAAQELVTALEASDAKIILQARINSVQMTINGIVTAVNNATTEVQLYSALSVAPFVNVDVENITAYDTALAARNFTTVAAIQTIVDNVNAGAVNADITTLVNTAVASVVAAEADPDGLVGATTETLVEAAQADIDALPTEIPQAVATALTVNVTVKADLQERLEAVKVVVPVLEASNQIELLAALQNPAFERVNADLIGTYETDLNGTEITIAAIQADIDAANLLAAQNAVDAAEISLDAADVATAQALVNNLPDLDPNTVKDGLQTDLDVATALIAVADATTEAELLTALQSEVLALTDVNPEAIDAYKTLVDGGATIATATNVQDNVVTAGNAAALASAVLEVVSNFGGYDETLAADQTAALAELNRLAAVSADVDATTILPELIEDYIVAIDTDLTGGSATITGTDAAKAQAIQDLIDGVNAGLEEANRLAAVNTATTAAEMRTALTAVAVAETDAYVNLSSQAKLEVAELVLVARDAITAPVADEFANTAAVTSAIGTATTARTTFLGNVNGATDIAGMITALDVVEFPEFQALSDLEQVDAAEAVLDTLTALKAETPANSFKTIAAIKAAAGL